MGSHEKWKPIRRYAEVYSVSSLGRIKSRPRYVRTRGNGLRFVREKILKAGLSGNGYLVVSLYRKMNGIIKVATCLVHRLVAEAYAPREDKSKNEVNHKNGDKFDCRASNLEWTDSQGNHKHATRLGLHKNKKARLNWRKVERIRIIAATEQLTFRAIGKMFHISGTSVRAIVQQKYWKDSNE